MRIGVVCVDVPLGVFDDYDGVIDYEPSRQSDAEQRQRIDREAEYIDERESSN